METQTKNSKLRKYVYLAVCSVLGVLLFVFIAQLIEQFLLILNDQGMLDGAFSLVGLDLVVSILNIIALGAGAWYGVWLGSYWYEKVYGTESSGGFMSHLSRKVSSGNRDEHSSGWQMDDLFSMPKPEVSAETVEEEPKKKVAVKRTRSATRTRKVSAPKIQSTSPKKPVVPVKKRASSKKTVVS